MAIVTIVAVAVIAGQQHSASAPAVPRLPSTPQQWVSRGPPRRFRAPPRSAATCTRRRSARAFKGDTGHSCAWYYTSVKSTSFRIRHVLEDGPTAAVEAQEVGAGRKRGYLTMLLSHIRGGWQAVDVVPGDPARPR